MNYIYGTDDTDTLFGSDGRDAIWGSGGNDTIYGGKGQDKLYGGAGDDTIYITSGLVSADDGDDTIYATAQSGSAQIHIYAGSGNDIIDLNFADQDYGILNPKWPIYELGFSHGHHARGDAIGSTNPGNDIFNFTNISNVGSGEVVMGRIEDFDASRDEIQIDGYSLNLTTLQAEPGYTVRVVEYGGEQSGIGEPFENDPQQWLLIETSSGGTIFYALEGARVVEDGTGGANSAKMESHFLVTEPDFANLTDVDYVDPVNVIPLDSNGNEYSYNGERINDVDGTLADANRVIVGSDHNDLIAAGLNNDSVEAGAGNDVVWGGSGHDRVHGNQDDDTLFGGTGNDRLYGDNDDDRLIGGHGEDRLYGGSGNDRLYGGDRKDFLYGGSGDDYFVGGSGWDVIDGGDGSDDMLSYYSSGSGVTVDVAAGTTSVGDTFSGIENIRGSEAGNDTLYGDSHTNDIMGGGGNDRIWGRDGSDSLFGGGGNDSLYGGNGNDFFISEDGNDFIHGGAGTDTVSYEAELGSLVINFNAGVDNNGDTFDQIENLIASNVGDDHITGNMRENFIQGLGGNDTLYGKNGDDKLSGGNGDDILHGGNQNDRLSGNNHDDILKGGNGDDFLDGGQHNDLLHGGSGSDTFHFDIGEDHDRIDDFKDGVDTIELDGFENLFTTVSGALSYATAVGSDIVFNFDNGDTLTIDDTTIGELSDDLAIV